MAIAHISVGDVESIVKINQSIDQANKVDAKAETSALASEVANRQQAIVALPLADLIHTRPGEAVNYCCSSIDGGDPTLLPAVDPSKVRFDDAGFVIRQAGDGIIASRMLYALEPGRKYLVEYAVQRRVNSPDPDNDAIKCAVAWYDQARNSLGQVTVQNLMGVTTGSGRLTVQAVISRAAADDVNVVSPANARYARPFVQTYGTLVQNDIEVIRWTDITNASAYSPDLTALEGRTTALESVDAGDRLTTLEGQVTAPNSVRLAIRADIAAATIPVSADTIEITGDSAVGDGYDDIFVRSDSTNYDIQSADGAYWKRSANRIAIVAPSIAAMGALLPSIRQVVALESDGKKGLFYPKLISSLSPEAQAEIALDTDHNVYLTSTVDPNYAYVRQGAEKRGFFAADTYPVHVERLAGRVMLGDSATFAAYADSAANGDTGAAWARDVKDGATDGMAYLERVGRLVSSTSYGIALTGLVRGTDSELRTGLGIHGRAEGAGDLWGGYIDVVRNGIANGRAQGLEIDVASCIGQNDNWVQPYGYEADNPQDATNKKYSFGLVLASGADPLVNPDAFSASHALGITKNGSTWNTGILFRSDALTADLYGYYRAISMGQRQKIGWHTSNGEFASITSQVTDTAALLGGHEMVFAGGALQFFRKTSTGARGAEYLRLLSITDAVNFLSFVPATAGNKPTIRVTESAEANVGILFQTKGAAWIGVNYSALVPSVTTPNRSVRVRAGSEDIDLLGVLVA